jgi:hypothetical protein
MLFILYIVFALLKINEVLIWIYDSLIPSIDTDRFLSDLICFQLDLFYLNLNLRFFMLDLEYDHVLI